MAKVEIAEPAWYKFTLLSPTEDDIAAIKEAKRQLRLEPRSGFPVRLGTNPKECFINSGKWRIVYDLTEHEDENGDYILITHIDNRMVIIE
jgi:hypothetical protein